MAPKAQAGKKKKKLEGSGEVRSDCLKFTGFLFQVL